MNTTLVDLVRKLRKGVVSVVAPPYVQDLKATSEEDLEEATKRVQQEPFVRGTAFAVSPNKFLTCYHVVKDLLPPRTIVLQGSFGETVGSPQIMHNVIKASTDPVLDIALLETKSIQGEVVPLGMGTSFPQVGTDIVAVGYPLPQVTKPTIDKFEKKVKVHITATFRAIKGIVASRLSDGTHFEIDKHLNPGHSGGPIVSIDTEDVLGVCQAFTYLSSGMPTDLSTCISAEAICKRLKEGNMNI